MLTVHYIYFPLVQTLSSWSTTSLEEVSDCSPEGLRWFQLYVYKDRQVTLDLIRRAERSGYRAIAVTADTPILGRREVSVLFSALMSDESDFELTIYTTT
jgi:isopentenyl diphosphate isomerase/L-lactate dehydrogenase-like FMN-dependent dehydrogenase